MTAIIRKKFESNDFFQDALKNEACVHAATVGSIVHTDRGPKYRLIKSGAYYTGAQRAVLVDPMGPNQRDYDIDIDDGWPIKSSAVRKADYAT